MTPNQRMKFLIAEINRKNLLYQSNPSRTLSEKIAYAEAAGDMLESILKLQMHELKPVIHG